MPGIAVEGDHPAHQLRTHGADKGRLQAHQIMRGVMWEPAEEHMSMWNRGWSCTRIAEAAGVSKETVCRAMRRRGIDLKCRPTPVVDEAIRESWRLRGEGMVMRDIADVVGYSRRQIQRWLNPRLQCGE